MSKVIAIMSMSLDGYVADRNDGVAEVFADVVSGWKNKLQTVMANVTARSFLSR